MEPARDMRVAIIRPAGLAGRPPLDSLPRVKGPVGEGLLPSTNSASAGDHRNHSSVGRPVTGVDGWGVLAVGTIARDTLLMTLRGHLFLEIVDEFSEILVNRCLLRRGRAVVLLGSTRRWAEWVLLRLGHRGSPFVVHAVVHQWATVYVDVLGSSEVINETREPIARHTRLSRRNLRTVSMDHHRLRLTPRNFQSTVADD